MSDVILFIDERSPQACLLFILEEKRKRNVDERCDDERVFYFKPYE